MGSKYCLMLSFAFAFWNAKIMYLKLTKIKMLGSALLSTVYRKNLTTDDSLSVSRGVTRDFRGEWEHP